MTKLYRLLARAEMGGAVREPGFIFPLEDGERGPHRTLRASSAGAAQGRDDLTQMRDEPLYEPVEADIHSNPKEIT